MNVFLRFSILALMCCIFSGTTGAQSKYRDHSMMIRTIEALGKEYPALCSVKPLGKSAGGKDLMIITIGTGDRDNKPGIAVLGGIGGSHVLGRELAAGFAAYLLKNSESPEIKNLLGKITFYVIPDVSPDASGQFFSDLKYERNVNDTPVDDDRDFVSNEDPFEDLNNDGLITLMRVSDPSGNYIRSPEDERIMIEADISKGETGSYLVFSEGIDNDKDGKFNEDGPGGVNFNRNLTYNYEAFGAEAGPHPVSEPESIAVLDFLFDHFNIYATMAFGTQDNLNQQAKPAGGRQTGTRSGEPGNIPGGAGQFQFPGVSPMQGPPPGPGSMRMMTGQARKITSVLPQDETIINLVSEKYREITGVKGNPVSTLPPGNFMEWSYYHYGRYSFSTPAWWFPVEAGKNPGVAFLKFAEENNMENVFVPWTEIKHPDFPGKKVEVGGIKPFVSTNPPEDKLQDLIEKNSRFIVEMAGMHPELQFLDMKVEDQGENIFRLSLKVHNKGIFATSAAAGERNVFTRLMRISLETSGKQKFLSGQKVQVIQRLEGGESTEYSWLIMGKGAVKITAGAVNTGIITTTAELK